MREFIKKNLNILIFLIPLCFYAIGFFIHNYYLARYNVANYELIKGKYIYAGFIYTFIFISVGFFYFIHTSYSNPQLNFKRDNLFLWFFRFECVLLAFYQFFPDKEKSALITGDMTILGMIKIPEKFITNFPTLIIYSLILWFIFSISVRGEYPEKKEKKIIIFWALIYFVPANFLIIWGIIFNKLFLSIFYFLGLYFLYVVAFMFGGAYGAELLYARSTLFEEKYSESLHRVEKHIVRWIFIAPIIILLTSIYSRNIYNKLPSNFGGAKLIEIQITYSDSKNVKGYLIDETANSIIIKFKEEDKVSIINKGSIKEIEILEQKKQ